MADSLGLPGKIFSASLWSVTAELISGGARALSYVLYANLLSPTDFGVVGFAVLLAGLFPLLIDNSLALALMRLKEDDQSTFSTIFYVNVCLSAAAVVVLCVAAGPAAGLMHDERVAAILRVLSLQLLMNSLCAAHTAVARRRFQYRRLVPIRLISTVVSLAVGIPLAYHGAGYWSLVGGLVSGACAQMVASWLILDWRPSWTFDWNAVRSISRFASWVGLDMAVTWLVMSGGGFFLALFLGAHDLGIFRLSDQIDTYVFGALLNPLIPVLYVAYCEASGAPDKLRPLFLTTNRAISLIALSVAGATVVLSTPLERLVGSHWGGIGQIVALNAIADGISFALLPSPSLMRAQGGARIVACMRLALVIGQIVVYSFAAAHGLRAFLLGKIGLELLMFLATYGVLAAKFSIPALRESLRQAVQALFVAVCVVAGIGFVTYSESSNPIVSGLTGLICFAIPLMIFVFFMEREVMVRLLRALQSRP